MLATAKVGSAQESGLGSAIDDRVLHAIEDRVLWLATYMVHHANHIRINRDGLKVGGHQTSSASTTTILTSLYFDFLEAEDKISIKPHASPVFHAIQYLVGNLDARYLSMLRAFDGLQSYPSRTKDPDSVEFSTGSVGIGSIAPNFASLVARYLRDHQLRRLETKQRFISLVGDAELDEGSVWEAIAEPALHDARGLVWVVDLNRQSLDRIIPGIRVKCWREMFSANGWKVIDVKYGSHLAHAFSLPNGDIFKVCIDELENEVYQRLLRSPGKVIRERLPRLSRFPQELSRFLDQWNDEGVSKLFGNLGGHDFGALRLGWSQTIDADGPAVIFAYTLKGHGLPSEGHPQNHSVLLTVAEVERLRERLRVRKGEEWAKFDLDAVEGQLCRAVGARLQRNSERNSAHPDVRLEFPISVGCEHIGLRSTQQAFGHILTAVARECPAVASRIVTVSPDVATSTNLGGWINKMEVWKHHARVQLDLEAFVPDAERSSIRWHESEVGQHIELGISENNLFMALGQLGLSRELFGPLLLPIGTLYDPFVRRGLDAFFYGVYAGAKFIVVGTPSGITLASEGGAHQSIGSQSLGSELPGVEFYEPCFGPELEWIFMHALSQLSNRRTSTYFRLSTKPVDQRLFDVAANEIGLEKIRDYAIRGAYRIIDRSRNQNYCCGRNVVHVFAAGVIVSEAIAASEILAQENIFANVINVTGPGPLYRDFQRSRNRIDDTQCDPSFLSGLFPASERRAPVVTVVDDHPHALAWIGAALGTHTFPLGITDFGQSGNCDDLYREYGIAASSIISACRRAVADYSQKCSESPCEPRTSI